jgi:hypothetical protein
VPSTRTPHFAFPFRRDSRGKIVVVEQDTAEHRLSRADVIMACPIGSTRAHWLPPFDATGSRI